MTVRRELLKKAPAPRTAPPTRNCHGLGEPLQAPYLRRGEAGDIDVGVPEAMAEINAQALSLFALGDSDWITEDVLSLLGRPARTSEQSATDDAASFAQSQGDCSGGKAGVDG
jgi:hypothetical protein